MYIYTPLVGIEITRKCNLSCEHCLRGNACNVSINKDILDKIFDEVKVTNTIVISGGEPFLCYDEIKCLCDVLKEKRVLVNNVVIVTNGTVYDDRIYNILEDNFDKVVVNISLDDYHIKSMEEMNFSVSSFNPRLKPNSKDDILTNIELHKNNNHFGRIYGNSKYLINMGRARNIDKPKIEFSALGYFYADVIESFSDVKFLSVGPRIYVDALGFITDGNTEYSFREELSIGNIFNSSIVSMIFNNAIKLDVSTIEEFNDFISYREYENDNSSIVRYAFLDNKIVEVKEKRLTL